MLMEALNPALSYPYCGHGVSLRTCFGPVLVLQLNTAEADLRVHNYVYRSVIVDIWTCKFDFFVGDSNI